MLRSAARTLALTLAFCASSVFFAHAKPVKTDYQIDGLDPGVRLFVRQKMEAGNIRFTDDNVVLFVHGATGRSCSRLRRGRTCC